VNVTKKNNKNTNKLEKLIISLVNRNNSGEYQQSMVRKICLKGAVYAVMKNYGNN